LWITATGRWKAARSLAQTGWSRPAAGPG
jgi:hypothetical protein